MIIYFFLCVLSVRSFELLFPESNFFKIKQYSGNTLPNAASSTSQFFNDFDNIFGTKSFPIEQSSIKVIDLSPSFQVKQNSQKDNVNSLMKFNFFPSFRNTQPNVFHNFGLSQIFQRDSEKFFPFPSSIDLFPRSYGNFNQLKQPRYFKKDAIKKDAIKKDAIKKDAIKKDAIKKDAVKKDAVKKDAVKKDAVKKDAVKKDAIKKDAIKKDAIKKDAIKKDAIKKDAIKKDAIKKDAIKKDAVKSDLSFLNNLVNFMSSMISPQKNKNDVTTDTDIMIFSDGDDNLDIIESRFDVRKSPITESYMERSSSFSNPLFSDFDIEKNIDSIIVDTNSKDLPTSNSKNDEVRQLKRVCVKDAQKFCAYENGRTDFFETMACLNKNIKFVSTTCLQELKNIPSFYCAVDVINFCKKGTNDIRTCLLPYANEISPYCLMSIETMKTSKKPAAKLPSFLKKIKLPNMPSSVLEQTSGPESQWNFFKSWPIHWSTKLLWVAVAVSVCLILFITFGFLYLCLQTCCRKKFSVKDEVDTLSHGSFEKGISSLEKSLLDATLENNFLQPRSSVV